MNYRLKVKQMQLQKRRFVEHTQKRLEELSALPLIRASLLKVHAKVSRLPFLQRSLSSTTRKSLQLILFVLTWQSNTTCFTFQSTNLLSNTSSPTPVGVRSCAREREQEKCAFLQALLMISKKESTQLSTSTKGLFKISSTTLLLRTEQTKSSSSLKVSAIQ